MLNDISGMADWAKVCTGLMRMFEGELKIYYISYYVTLLYKYYMI